MFSHPRLRDVKPPEAPENARVQGAPGIWIVIGGILSFAVLFAVLAWPVAHFAAHPAKVWITAVLIGAGMGLVVATSRKEIRL